MIAPSRILLAVDFGHVKTGIAVVDAVGFGLVYREIVKTDNLRTALEGLSGSYSPAQIVLGKGTGHQAAVQILSDVFAGIPVALADERDTTRRAFGRYLAEVSGGSALRYFAHWVKAIVKPPLVDDFAAYEIALVFLKAGPHA